MSDTRKIPGSPYDTEALPQVDPRKTVVGGPRNPHVKLIAQDPGRDTLQAPAVRPAKGRKRRENFMAGCLAIGGALTAFACVAGIVAAILLPGMYRSQRPEMQAIWCNRAQKVMMDFVCDWKPTPAFEFIPTLGSTEDPNFDPMSILTPVTSTPGGAATESSMNITPFAASLNVAALPTLTNTPVLVQPTLTQTPTPSPSPNFTATPIPTATLLPLPVSYKLDLSKLFYQAQTWNNCGPATLSIGLSYFGYRQNQAIAARYLKPNPEDKNVSPYQMVSYVNQVASAENPTNALTRVGGDLELLKRLISHEFPVIIEKGYDVNDLGWMGHYLLIVGYDDILQELYTYDSFLGHGNSQGLPEDYSHITEYWRHFNNTFIVLYDPIRQDELLDLLGAHADAKSAAEIALERARQDVTDHPEDGWSWFNLGHSYTLLGNYEQAVQAFDQAFTHDMPWRVLWYLHQPFTAYFAMGRYNDILTLADTVQAGTVYVEELFYYRGAVYAAQGDTAGAKAEFDRALQYNSNFQAARIARDALDTGQFTTNLVLSVGT
jgi:hypothetical protein